MAGEAMDICLRVLKESNKSRFDSYSVRNSVLNISHITFRDCRVHIFFESLSRNSCKQYTTLTVRFTGNVLPLSCYWKFEPPHCFFEMFIQAIYGNIKLVRRQMNAFR